MTFAELKNQILLLSVTQRSQLADYLKELTDEDAFRKTIDKRMKAMDEGHKITAEEVERRHKELIAKGR